MTAILETLLEIAFEAAAVVREVYETPFAVDWKGPKDPVTAADVRANDLICRRLANHFPGVPVVAEESDPSSFLDYRTASRVFFVDPLDGTAEFVDRNGEFVVMIGLVEDRKSTTGVVVAPATGRAWAGRVGEGTFTVAPDGTRSPARVSDVTALPAARIVASRSHRSAALERALALIGGSEVVAIGSAGLKGAAIAAGRADIYAGTGIVGKRWDVCAIDALITAAGGRLTDSFGRAFDYHADSLVNDRGVVAANEPLHPLVIERLAALVAGSN